MSGDEAQLARYGELVARLAWPLADRSAVLWLAKLDETRFAELEQRCLDALESNPQRSGAFARAFARTSRQLAASAVEPRMSHAVREGAADPATVPPTTPESPMAASPDATDLALQTETLAIGQSAPPQPHPTTQPRRELDPLEAMFTLASKTQAKPAPPTRREGDDD